MDGYTVFYTIREADKTVPVIAITALGGSAQRQRALQAGFSDYIVKPISEIEEFKLRVYSHITEHASHKCA